jgi:uncharacterized oxidoreductase
MLELCEAYRVRIRSGNRAKRRGEPPSLEKSTMPTLHASALEEFAGALFVAAGISSDDAKVVAASLVGANLRGHDSHGVMRVPFYIAAVQERRLDPGAELKVNRQTSASVVCDAGWGFGQVQAQRMLRLLMPKAKALGVACGAMQRSGHIGRVGEYAEIACAEGLAFIAMVNTHGAAPRVAPPGGKRPRLGTNPLCVGVPTGLGADSIVLDFGTSATAEGKVRVKRIAGHQCPPGWIIDADGKPTTDPNVLYGEPQGSILPMGGDQAYKGFGLGLVIDMLAGGLSGGLCSRPNPDAPLGNDVVFILLDPAQFGGTEHFLTQVTGVAAHVRGCPTADGVREILLPGDPERRTFAERSANGIPIDDGNWKQLVDLATKLGVSVPSTGVRSSVFCFGL